MLKIGEFSKLSRVSVRMLRPHVQHLPRQPGRDPGSGEIRDRSLLPGAQAGGLILTFPLFLPLIS